MLKITLAVTILIISAVSFGCAAKPIPFSETHFVKYRDKLKNIQFYVSHDIVLKREIRSENAVISPGHTVRVEKGKRLEEVTIRWDTPGVVLYTGREIIDFYKKEGLNLAKHSADKITKQSLAVSFELPVDGKERALVFTLLKSGSPQLFFLSKFNDGQRLNARPFVFYAGKRWRCYLSYDPYLTIDLNQVEKVVRESRVASGRRLP